MRRQPTCVLTDSAPPRADHGHDPDRFVQIGSLTKALTGTVLTRLAAAGVLGLDDPLERRLPVPAGTGITLRQLALHTSGLPRLPPGLTGGRDPYLSFDDQALRGLLGRLDSVTVRPPGQQEEYSNLGYAVLGAALVETVGRPYEELLREYVIDPLGVEDVTADPPAERRLLAPGLLGGTRKPWTMNGAILPAGGLWATPRAAADLVTGLLVERKLGDPAPSWQVAGPLLWHNGATGDASVFAGAMPDGRWVVVHRLNGSHDQTDRDGLRILGLT